MLVAMVKAVVVLVLVLVLAVVMVMVVAAAGGRGHGGCAGSRGGVEELRGRRRRRW